MIVTIYYGVDLPCHNHHSKYFWEGLAISIIVVLATWVISFTDLEPIETWVQEKTLDWFTKD
jgi:hypothetical protein